MEYLGVRTMFSVESRDGKLVELIEVSQIKPLSSR